MGRQPSADQAMDLDQARWSGLPCERLRAAGLLVRFNDVYC